MHSCSVHVDKPCPFLSLPISTSRIPVDSNRQARPLAVPSPSLSVPTSQLLSTLPLRDKPRMPLSWHPGSHRQSVYQTRLFRADVPSTGLDPSDSIRHAIAAHPTATLFATTQPHVVRVSRRTDKPCQRRAWSRPIRQSQPNRFLSPHVDKPTARPGPFGPCRQARPHLDQSLRSDKPSHCHAVPRQYFCVN